MKLLLQMFLHLWRVISRFISVQHEKDLGDATLRSYLKKIIFVHTLNK